MTKGPPGDNSIHKVYLYFYMHACLGKNFLHKFEITLGCTEVKKTEVSKVEAINRKHFFSHAGCFFPNNENSSLLKNEELEVKQPHLS